MPDVTMNPAMVTAILSNEISPATGTADVDVSAYLAMKGYTVNAESDEDRANRWFFTHLRNMNDPDQVMIVLMILFPLYEKYLRALDYADPGNLAPSNPAFAKIGTDLGISSAVAFEFWTNCRNGLLHRAVIKASSTFTAILDRSTDGVAITTNGSIFTIKPFLIRDRLVTVMMAEPTMWSADSLVLPFEYRCTDE